MAKTLNLRDKTFSCWKLHIGVTKENFKLIMRQSPLHQIEGYYAILAATERYIEDIDSIHILYISVVYFFYCYYFFLGGLAKPEDDKPH